MAARWARRAGRYAGLTGALAAGAGLGAGVAARWISGPQRPALDYRITPFELGLDFEQVAFEASDGTRLAGWWLDRPGSERVVVVCHGHRGTMADMLGIGPGLWRAGNSVLLFDFRGNGESEDGPQSLALYEQRDLRAAIDLAVARCPEARVAVVGFSMGAAVAALEAADDQRVEALVLDSAFAEMRDVIAVAGRRLRLPPFPLLPLIDHATRLRYGYRFADVRPVDAIARFAPRPVLLLHSNQDHVIPVSHAHELFAAAGEPKQLVIFEGADHCGGYFQDRQGYIDRVARFLASVLP